MINISLCVDNEVINNILTDDNVWLGITEWGTPKAKIDFLISPNIRFMLVSDDEKQVGMFVLRHVSSLCVELHSAFIHKGYSKRSFLALAVWLLKYTTYEHIITFVPEHNKIAYNAAIKSGFKEEGFIPNSFRWEGNVPEGQYILGVDL
jgi:RimJ/RimL family protein N-acetyltransferase